jgi:hypothetical protein
MAYAEHNRTRPENTPSLSMNPLECFHRSSVFDVLLFVGRGARVCCATLMSGIVKLTKRLKRDASLLQNFLNSNSKQEKY